MVFGDLIFTEGVTKELMASDFARNHSLGKRLGLSDVRVDLVRAPGEVFRGANQDELTDILLGIARDGFGTDIPIEEVRDNAFNCDALYLISYGDKIKGFCSYKFIEHKGQKILHLKGVVLEKEIQKHKHFYEVNKRAISDLSESGFDYLVMRTQNPVIYAATSNLVSELFPNVALSEGAIPETIRDIALAVPTPKLPDDRMVIRGLYGRCLYDQVQHHKKASAFFKDVLELDYDSGDSVVLVGKI
ncbi:hypothetical protein HN587_04975 [Candidatus Woesearchaeota archaeon]|jgi:hypothetical protein|nr:hypothetical protein [Candidatus Woesearchaeota archaeon]